MNQNWEHLKVGDLVIVDHNAIRRVARITPTQIVLVFKNTVGTLVEVKYNKSSGNRVGDSTVWDRGQITSSDVNDIQALRQRIVRERHIGYIYSWIYPLYKGSNNQVPDDVMEKIYDLLLENEKRLKEKENEQPKV